MLYRHYNYWAIGVRQSPAGDTLGNNVGHGANVWEQYYEWFPLQFSCNRWAVEGMKDDGVTLCGSCFMALCHRLSLSWIQCTFYLYGECTNPQPALKTDLWMRGKNAEYERDMIYRRAPSASRRLGRKFFR